VNLKSLFKRRKMASDYSKYTMVRKPLSFCVLNLFTLANVSPVSSLSQLTARGTFMDHLTSIPV